MVDFAESLIVVSILVLAVCIIHVVRRIGGGE